MSKNKYENKIQQFVEENKPDIIISVIPNIDLFIGNIAKKNHIPFLLITTEDDLEKWVRGLKNFTYQNFQVTIGNESQINKGRLLANGIPEESIKTTGLPLRLDFLEKKNKEELKRFYQVPEGKSVVLLMMGGTGSTRAVEYAKRALSINGLSMHLIVCAGRDIELKDQLSKLPIAPSNSLCIMPFTDKISDLMAISDLFITKPGPGSITEAMALRVPMLIDATGSCLYWEKANIGLVCDAKVGDQIKSYKELEPMLKKYLNDPETRQDIQKAYDSVTPNQFHEKIKPIVSQMISAPKS